MSVSWKDILDTKENKQIDNLKIKLNIAKKEIEKLEKLPIKLQQLLEQNKNLRTLLKMRKNEIEELKEKLEKIGSYKIPNNDSYEKKIAEEDAKRIKERPWFGLKK